MLQQIYPQVQHNYYYELNKDMQFAAAHYIPHDAAGKCANMHGHTYFCNLTIAGDDLDDTGFLVNFHILKELVHDRYDHKVVNEVHDFSSRLRTIEMPSTEMLAEEIWSTVQTHLDTLPNQPKCLQVFLRETPTSYVVFRQRRYC